jgi:hypothetical protein
MGIREIHEIPFLNQHAFEIGAAIHKRKNKSKD